MLQVCTETTLTPVRLLQELYRADEDWEAFAEFPWGFFVVTCGFLVVFTIDKLVGSSTSSFPSQTPAAHLLHMLYPSVGTLSIQPRLL